MFRTILTGTVALCAALAVAASANAAGLAAQGENAIKLHYTDGEIHSAEGAKVLARRIREAADKTCNAEAPFADALVAEAKCRETAISRAISDLNAPLVADALGRSPSVLAKAGH